MMLQLTCLRLLVYVAIMPGLVEKIIEKAVLKGIYRNVAYCQSPTNDVQL